MEWPQRYVLIWTYLLYGYGNIKCHDHEEIDFSLSKITKKMCYLKPDEGPCRAEIEMYYFSPDSMGCSTFIWGGCQGNGNRFDSKSECLNTCLGGRLKRPTYCSLRFDYGFCFGEDRRWFYDHKWGVCRETIFSGCGGNKNNFYVKEQCEAICRFGFGKRMTPPPDEIQERRLRDEEVLKFLANMTMDKEMAMRMQQRKRIDQKPFAKQ